MECLRQSNYCEDTGTMTGSSGASPSTSIPQINEILVDDDDTPIEISISVPNLCDSKNCMSPTFNHSVFLTMKKKTRLGIQKMKLVEKRRMMFKKKQSVSLDCA